jgi:hypothetical protein
VWTEPSSPLGRDPNCQVVFSSGQEGALSIADCRGAHYHQNVAESLERIASSYRRFADHEARGRSSLYEEVAREVAGDESTLMFLSELPPSKQQPNLLFGAVRYACGTPSCWGDFRDLLVARRDEIREVMLKRRTQTNDPARCATLLPLLALLPQPLALLEIGASAGLCLIPDRYAYFYNNTVHIPPVSEVGVAPPTFSCETNLETPIPKRNVDVVWRAGLDLEPIGVHDNDEVAWLEALVWPGEQDRLSLLRQALNVARQSPPPVMQGDLRVDLTELAAQAPAHATLVIFHSAVLAYISSIDERTALANAIGHLHAVWISNEVPAVSPCENERLSATCPEGLFLLVKDKRPIACADPHGRFVRWFRD